MNGELTSSVAEAFLNIRNSANKLALKVSSSVIKELGALLKCLNREAYDDRGLRTAYVL